MQAMEGMTGQAQEISALILQAAALLGLQGHSKSAGTLLQAMLGKVEQLTQEPAGVAMNTGPLLDRSDYSDDQVGSSCARLPDHTAGVK